LLTSPSGATIQAELKAHAIIVTGAVMRNVTATGQIDIRETGSVDSDIKARTCASGEGAVLNGRIETGAAAAKDNEQTVSQRPV
jgi:cytoskeletal protein CcmA (bactofilin family)